MRVLLDTCVLSELRKPQADAGVRQAVDEIPDDDLFVSVISIGEIAKGIAPAFVMPYMTGRNQEVNQALFLMRFHVPCWAIAHVFGRDAMYLYRFEQGLGRFNVVGTTVKSAEYLPKNLVADEKHSWLKGQRVYIVTTVAKDCILGASIAKIASQKDLETAYGVFANEAKALDADYAPETVNTDGWPATQNAWKALFKRITVILCFLHGWIKIRDRAKKAFGDLGQEAQTRVWDAYRAPSKRAFAQRLRRLREWASDVLPKSEMKQKTLDLCDKRDAFSPSYDHPSAHRTSNMVDRLMRFLDRAFFNAQYFHGLPESAENRVRALALLWNLCPSSPQTVKKHGGQSCPAERLNGKCYADNWLENLLVSGSMNGVEQVVGWDNRSSSFWPRSSDHFDHFGKHQSGIYMPQGPEFIRCDYPNPLP